MPMLPTLCLAENSIRFVSFWFDLILLDVSISLADLRGVPGMCAPSGSNFFHFHAVLGDKRPSNRSDPSPWRLASCTPLGNSGSATEIFIFILKILYLSVYFVSENTSYHQRCVNKLNHMEMTHILSIKSMANSIAIVMICWIALEENFHSALVFWQQNILCLFYPHHCTMCCKFWNIIGINENEVSAAALTATSQICKWSVCVTLVGFKSRFWLHCNFSFLDFLFPKTTFTNLNMQWVENYYFYRTEDLNIKYVSRLIHTDCGNSDGKNGLYWTPWVAIAFATGLRVNTSIRSNATHSWWKKYLSFHCCCRSHCEQALRFTYLLYFMNVNLNL